ncbi:hypothetical protein PtA15_5A928 [Puccinia triticina]|uniref:Uncharacterized protein n=1 Tax=Puccinia triticina TaxID=208348 RepID=A0ABY7CKB1_9BASI|nr:uncharacterized protein PtA15_5A928 [Puccinia triticina]WAQ85353.1 hypothetical protein PtA15_5A928 [Puccinia triticina]WAR58644.1 hypothetical protein PtB15_5B879 [Puccinia triticina]
MPSTHQSTSTLKLGALATWKNDVADAIPAASIFAYPIEPLSYVPASSLLDVGHIDFGKSAPYFQSR